MPQVSVILPNYNHANYLVERIESILEQSYQDFELILLDDCSTDESKSILNTYKDHPKVSHFICNEQNSGSTFHQWKKGIELAKGELIWIAESDDVAHFDFLKSLVPFFVEDNKCGLAYCNSQIIDSSGIPVKLDGLFVTPKDTKERYDHSFINDGIQEIKTEMLPLNKIPNASAVLFRKNLVDPLNLRSDMKICGDWYFWITIMKNCKMAFCADTLNSFRTHPDNVRTKLVDPNIIFSEYLEVLKLVICLTDLSQKMRSHLADNLIYRYLNSPNYRAINFKTKIRLIKSMFKLEPKSLFKLLKSRLRKK